MSSGFSFGLCMDTPSALAKTVNSVLYMADWFAGRARGRCGSGADGGGAVDLGGIDAWDEVDG